MFNNGSSSDMEQTRTPSEARKDVAASSGQVPATPETPALREHYSDMQSAVRFPIKLPVSVRSNSGESRAETENISANGVLFQMESDMPVGSMVDFTISLPADVVGSEVDVQLDCRGRVVRSFEDSGRRGVGVVIDEYRFERR